MLERTRVIDPERHPPFINAAIPGLVGRVGPFSKLEYQRTPSDYDFLHAMIVRLHPFGVLEEGLAAGGGFTPRRARTAALGEAIERCALRQHNPRNTRIARADDPTLGRHIDPTTLLHYPPAAYAQNATGLVRFQPCDAIHWIQGRRLRDDAPIWVPAFAVFTASPDRTEMGLVHDALLSTGAACAADRDTAALSGLYEVIERDAFMLHWENRWPGTPQPLPEAVSRLATQLKQKGFTLILRRLRTDVNAAIAVAQGNRVN